MASDTTPASDTAPVISTATLQLLSLRDYFAGIVLQQLVTEKSVYSWDCSSTAANAYNMADAMLQARAAERPKQEGDAA